MQAVICRKYGSPDVLHLEEADKPEPLENEILIKIKASTVNRTDCALLRAKPFISRFFTGFFKPRRIIQGTEFAGIIESAGKDVHSFKAGDRVFGFDDSLFGAHAQYMVITDDKALTLIPDHIGFKEAAASSEGFHYAYNFINKVKLKEGDKVLVNGSTGAIGSAMVQLLKYFSTDVTAVCNTENIELVKSLGADRIVDYNVEDFTKTDQKFNYVFDTVGKSSFTKCMPLLSADGVYISSELGFGAQNIFLTLITPIFRKRKVIFPLPVDSRASVFLVKKLIEEGKYKTVIDREYPMAQIIEAYKYVEKGEKTGNVVINVEQIEM